MKVSENIESKNIYEGEIMGNGKWCGTIIRLCNVWKQEYSFIKIYWKKEIYKKKKKNNRDLVYKTKLKTIADSKDLDGYMKKWIELKADKALL